MHTDISSGATVDAASPPSEALLALRARAEQRRRCTMPAAGQQSPQEMQRLIQELQAHQTELERQCEALLLAQEAAEAARLEYSDLYNFAPVGYFTLSAGGVIRQLNLFGSQQLGTVRQRLAGRRFALFVHPAGRGEFGQFLARVQATDGTVSCELALQREDGSRFFAQLEGRREAGSSGKAGAAPCCRLVVVDITTSRLATDALTASESRFRKLFAQSNDAVVLLHGASYVDCNAAALRLLGATRREQLVGHNAWAFSPDRQPDGRRTIDVFHEAVAEALDQDSKRCVARMRKLTGEEIWVEAVLTAIEPAGGVPLIHILWRDVTAQYAAQEELHHKSLVLERLLNNTPLVLTRLLPDGTYVEVVGAGLRAFGIEDNALVGQNAFEVFPSLLPHVHTVLGGEQARFLAEVEVAGQAVAFQAHGFFDEQRQQVVMLSVDVTEAEQQKRQLRSEKEFTQSLLENSVDGIVALDGTGHITAWNSQAARYFGYEAAAVLGQSLFAVLPHFDNGAARQIVARVLAGEQVLVCGQAFPHRAGHFDAYHVPLRPADEAAPTGILIMVRDVTERDRRAEEATRLRLRRQQEVLAAILDTQETERKRIAEALHNGLGQLLYATKLSLDGRDELSAPARESLKLLDEAIRTTRTISFELTPGILEDFGLPTALEELAKRIAPAGLPVHLHLTGLDQRLRPPVEITVYRVVQELLNNVMKHAAATEVTVHVARENGRIEMSVEDNGRGFEPASLATQPLTGIGLAGVRNRVALLGGELAIHSRLGQGTIVSFELGE